MGLTKRYMDEIDARGYADAHGRVCSVCITEPALAAVIQGEGDQVPCDFCDLTPDAPDASVELERIVRLVVDSFRYDYVDPAENALWDSREGGYQVPLDDTHDLLWEYEVAENDRVIDAIAEAINLDVWCQRDPYAPNNAQALQWGWSAFRHYVQNYRRYTFLSFAEDPTLGGGEIPMHQVPAAVVEAVEGNDLTTTFPAGSKWWRARIHPAGEAYTKAKEIGTPDNPHARDNRMSPKGIGAFYGATTLTGAKAEVAGYASEGSEATVGLFTQLTELVLVDLREPPEVPSLFDEDNRHLRGPRIFLRDFVANVTNIADPSDVQNLEYIPTQVIAEHLRYDLPADGICWRSTKDHNVTVCVLFLPNAAMVDADEEVETSLRLDPTSVTLLGAPLNQTEP